MLYQGRWEKRLDALDREVSTLRAVVEAQADWIRRELLGGTENHPPICKAIDSTAPAALDRDASHKLPDARHLRFLIRQRRKRASLFGADLFSDPAWDMLLDLAAARLENERVSVSSLCLASGAPQTTALRWIAMLQDAGLVVRRADPLDSRRAYIELTEKAISAMGRHFEEAEFEFGMSC